MTGPIPIIIDIDTGVGVKKLTGIKGRLNNMTPLMKTGVRLLAQEMFQQQFATEGRWGGDEWAPLAPSTIRTKPYRSDGGILVSTSALRSSLVRWKTKDNIFRANRKGITFGSKNPLAGIHQEGDPENNLPARHIIPEKIPGHWMKRLRATIRGYLIRGELGGGEFRDE